MGINGALSIFRLPTKITASAPVVYLRDFLWLVSRALWLFPTFKVLFRFTPWLSFGSLGFDFATPGYCSIVRFSERDDPVYQLLVAFITWHLAQCLQVFDLGISLLQCTATLHFSDARYPFSISKSSRQCRFIGRVPDKGVQRPPRPFLSSSLVPLEEPWEKGRKCRAHALDFTLEAWIAFMCPTVCLKLYYVFATYSFAWIVNMTRKIVSCLACIFPSLASLVLCSCSTFVCCANECEAKSNNLRTPSSGICLLPILRTLGLQSLCPCVRLAIVLLST